MQVRKQLSAVRRAAASEIDIARRAAEGLIRELHAEALAPQNAQFAALQAALRREQEASAAARALHAEALQRAAQEAAAEASNRSGLPAN